MKNFLRCVIVLSCFAIPAFGQQQYAVELYGGKTMNVDGPFNSPNGISGGVGVSMIFDKNLEIVGNAIFSKFAPAARVISDGNRIFDAYQPYGMHGENSYSCEISMGPRLHAHRLSFVHPYIELQGGLFFLRVGSASTPYSVVYALDAAAQFFSVHGSEDMQIVPFGSLGIGFQISPSDVVNINFETKLQVLFREEMRHNTLIPLLVSLQFPL